jgi:hypothetical protein
MKNNNTLAKLIFLPVITASAVIMIPAELVAGAMCGTAAAVKKLKIKKD